MMSIQKIKVRFTALLLFIIAVAAIRVPNSTLSMPWSNFTPIGAMGLFGGAYFTSKWKAIIFPLLTLLISDLIINYFIFGGKYGLMCDGWYVIYGIFVLIVFFGKWLLQTVNLKNVLLAALIAAMSHWLITDFYVWISGGTDLRTMNPLTRDWAGLFQCYAQGFPFMRNFLIGNLVYGGILFGGFELVQRRLPILKLWVV